MVGILDHREGPGMYFHGAVQCTAVEPADVALGVMEAHPLMDRCNLRKGRIDRAVRGRLLQSLDTKTDQCSQPGLRALNGWTV